MTTYKDSGVNITTGELLTKRIRSIANKTNRPEVLAGIGGFGALFEIPNGYTDPVLVSGCDGVGTKLKLAFLSSSHRTVGIDLVAMSVNDILVHGARPLFFLDYFSCGKLSIEVAEEVIKGVIDGCQSSGCALIGGETAEMPDMYKKGEYDLAGFAVGIVEKKYILNGSYINEGDKVIGLASSGLHSNGFSLVRLILKKILGENYIHEIKKKTFNKNKSLFELLINPTRIYVHSVHAVLEKNRKFIHGIAHITGGGLLENIPRVLPPNLKVRLNTANWVIPEFMLWLKEKGEVEKKEFFRVFNAGIGLVLFVDGKKTEIIKNILESKGERVFEIGEVTNSQDDLKIEII